MTRYEYDEEASAAWRMDVVPKMGDRSAALSVWVDAMRHLNTVEDPLARKLIRLHRDCGSGTGACDDTEDDRDLMDRRAAWGCETMELIADHLGVEYLAPLPRP